MKSLLPWGLIVCIGITINSCMISPNQETLYEPELPDKQLSTEDLNQQFISELLNDAQLLAFENKAIDLLKDYIDYVNIIIDPGMDSTFRIQSVTSLKSFVLPYDSLSGEQISHRITGSDSTYSIHEVRVIEPLFLINNYYSGQIEFVLKNDKNQNRQRIPMYTIRSRKSFGNEENLIWTVMLGEIKFE